MSGAETAALGNIATRLAGIENAVRIGTTVLQDLVVAIREQTAALQAKPERPGR